MSMRVGVVGVGTIAAYMVKGLLAERDKDVELYLSPRGTARTAELARLFPHVRVMPTNQAVLDESDWVLLAVRPQDAEEAVRPLRFSAGHKVLSVIAMTSLARLQTLMPKVNTFVRMIPLPFIERRSGPVVIYPDNQEILSLFEGLGQVILPRNEALLDVFSAISSSMSMFYRIVGQVAGWGEESGLSAEDAAAYTLSFYGALVETGARTPPAGLGNLWREMTPGGLNARAVEVMEAGGGFEIWNNALDEVMARIRR